MSSSLLLSLSLSRSLDIENFLLKNNPAYTETIFSLQQADTNPDWIEGDEDYRANESIRYYVGARILEASGSCATSLQDGIGRDGGAELSDNLTGDGPSPKCATNFSPLRRIDLFLFSYFTLFNP